MNCDETTTKGKNHLIRSKSQKKFCLQFIRFSDTLTIKKWYLLYVIFSCEVWVMGFLVFIRAPTQH